MTALTREQDCDGVWDACRDSPTCLFGEMSNFKLGLDQEGQYG